MFLYRWSYSWAKLHKWVMAYIVETSLQHLSLQCENVYIAKVGYSYNTVTVLFKHIVLARWLYFCCLLEGRSTSLNVGLSTPKPIAVRPLSTYKTVPLMAEASGDARKAAAFPTSSIYMSCFKIIIQHRGNTHFCQMFSTPPSWQFWAIYVLS